MNMIFPDTRKTSEARMADLIRERAYLYGTLSDISELIDRGWEIFPDEIAAQIDELCKKALHGVEK